MSTEDQVITLESYAAVVAGLGAGLPLTRALEHVSVGVLEWNASEEHWRAQIDESAASDLSLLVAFDAALISARRSFEPTVEPIESDVKAWAHFRRHFVTAVEPVKFLEKHGLSLSTYAQLERDWANRVLSDESLATKLKKHMAEPLEDCPSITLMPSALLVHRNSPVESRDTPAQTAPEPAIPAIAEESSFVGDAMTRAAASPPLVVNASDVAPAPIIEDPAGTTQFVTLQPFVASALPFNPNAKPTEPQSKIESRSVADMDPGQTMDWSLVASALSKPATPFESSSTKNTPEMDVGVTQFVTANRVHQKALPFDPSAPSSLPGRAHGDKPTSLESNVAPLATNAEEDQLGSTLMFDASQLLAAVTPFEKPAQSSQQAAPQGSSALSAFTLERYASICVEFALAPTQMREIAARYGINAEQWASVDGYWRGRMTKEPEIRAAWEKACVTYRQWLLQR